MNQVKRDKLRYLFQEAGYAQRERKLDRSGTITAFANAWEGLTKKVGPIPPGVDMFGPFLAGRMGNRPRPLMQRTELKDAPQAQTSVARALTIDKLKTFSDFEAYTRVNLGVKIKPEKINQMRQAFDAGRYTARDFGLFIAASMRKELTMGKTRQHEQGMDI